MPGLGSGNEGAGEEGGRGARGGGGLQRHRQLKIVQLTQMWIYRGELNSNGSLVECLWFVRTVRAEQHGDVSRVERLWLYGPCRLNLSP